MYKLNDEEKRVIIDKGTEASFIGEYVDNVKVGKYICRSCDSPLYSSKDKFESSCGWPSFDALSLISNEERLIRFENFILLKKIIMIKYANQTKSLKDN